MTDRRNNAAHLPNDAITAFPQQWQKIQSALALEIDENNFRSWILPITPQSFTAGTLTLAVPTRFLRDWVKTHYADTIARLWKGLFGSLLRVELVVDANTGSLSDAPEKLILPPVANDENVTAKKSLSSTLDPRFHFDSFVTGPSNELAFNAARKITESATPVFNPLYIYGAVGLGKTHLLQAIAHALSARLPVEKILYLSAERFMFQFVQALRQKDIQTFKSYFRGVDVLLIDDIQFICGKQSTQEEFIHTFNTLMDLGKQVIISSDRSPVDLKDIDERLRSRLGGGLAVQIHLPDYATRLAILQSKCALMNRSIPQDVLDFLAVTVTASVRELEGALNRLLAHAELMNRPVTLDTAKSLLQDQIRFAARSLTVEDIQKKVAEHFDIRLTDILSPRRSRTVARPRQIAMYLCKTLTPYSLPDIGRKFNGRDHTTILHGIRKVEELMGSDPDVRNAVEHLSRQFS